MSASHPTILAHQFDDLHQQKESVTLGMWAFLVTEVMFFGGVFLAFYYNNLFPEQVFHISRSIEIILGPIIGGMGTIFGPVLGAAVVALLADGTTEILAATNWQVPGLKQLIYGIALFVVVTLLPHGIWPALARKLKLSK